MILQPCFNYILIPLLVPHVYESQPLSQTQEEETQKIPIQPEHTQSSKLDDLDAFVLETGGISKKYTSIKYMKLAPPHSNFKVAEYREFRRLFSEVVGKYQRFYGQDRQKKSWGKNDVAILIWIVHRLSLATLLNPKDFSEEDWAKVSSLIPFRRPEQCKFKWLSMRRNQLQSNPWSNNQIESLLNLVKQDSGVDEEGSPDWGEISHEMFTRFGIFRTAKQCRQCWNIQVKSHHQSKKLWTKEEDDILLDLYRGQGRKWKLISGDLPGRSQNAIKNRFNLLYSRGAMNEIQEKIQDNSSTLKSEN